MNPFVKVHHKQDKDKERGSSFGFYPKRLALNISWVICSLHPVIPQLSYSFSFLKLQLTASTQQSHTGEKRIRLGVSAAHPMVPGEQSSRVNPHQ